MVKSCGGSAFGVYKLIFCFIGAESRMNYLACLVPAGIVAVVVYVLFTLALKATTYEEIELLPFGRTISAFLKKKNVL